MPARLSLTERLARRLVQPVDAATRARARLHLLDWLGCVAGGLRGHPTLTNSEPANLRTWLLGNVLEMDDIHRAAILHPGPVVWPAAAQRVFNNGTLGDVLDAGVRGYEAMIVVGETFDARHYRHYHNTATAGVFGAAAAASSLMRHQASRTAHALGLAGSLAGGLWRMRHESSETKQFHVLAAGETGLRAAHAADSGLRGPRFVLEGEQGLYEATCHEPKPMRLKAGWRIHDVSFKPFAACRHAHPAIDAALELRDAYAGESVRVTTYRDALTFCDRPHPRSVIDAKFSIQHAVAVALARGTAGLADFEFEAITDPAVESIRAKIAVEENPRFTARYPAHFGAKVTAGRHSVSLRDTLGDPERPIDADAIVAKSDKLMKWGGVSGKRRRKLISLVMESDDEDDRWDARFHKQLGKLVDAW